MLRLAREIHCKSRGTSYHFLPRPSLQCSRKRPLTGDRLLKVKKEKRSQKVRESIAAIRSTIRFPPSKTLEKLQLGRDSVPRSRGCEHQTARKTRSALLQKANHGKKNDRDTPAQFDLHHFSKKRSTDLFSRNLQSFTPETEIPDSESLIDQLTGRVRNASDHERFSFSVPLFWMLSHVP